MYRCQQYRRCQSRNLANITLPTTGTKETGLDRTILGFERTEKSANYLREESLYHLIKLIPQAVDLPINLYDTS